MKSTDDLAVEELQESAESACAYLREAWLREVLCTARSARRDSGLTQNEVAQRMRTTQSAIARFERDREGHVTLHWLIDYALACGVVPDPIVFLPLADARRGAALRLSGDPA